MSFFEELRRRKVIRVAIAYLIGGWLVLQLAEVLSELLSLPDSVGPIVVGAVAIGFPVVIFLSWAFELTAEGLKRDEEVTAEQRSSGKLINVLVVALLLAALGYFVWESRFADRSDGERSLANTAATQDTGAGTAAAPAKSIAVLPFENFSGNEEDQYFADGLADTLLHKLAQISDLKVIARNSSFQFKGTNKDIREIGEFLDVEIVLEGSVQRSGDQVRIIAQLINTSDGVHLWSQSFDGSMKDIFALQDEVTEDIVDQLQLSLSREERAKLLRTGTENPAAYDLVIRAINGDQAAFVGDAVSVEESPAIMDLRQAIELDPDYALAWAILSRQYNGLAFRTGSNEDYDRFVALALEAAETAVALNPELTAAQNAMGWVMHRKDESLRSAQHFRRALNIDPNNLEAMSGLALQLISSDPAEALALLERSNELDPRNSVVHRQQHFALIQLGRVEDAIEQMKQAIALAPENGLYYNDLSDLLIREGRPDEAAVYTSKLLQLNPTSNAGLLAMSEAWKAALEPGRAESWLIQAAAMDPDSDYTKFENVERLLTFGRYDEAEAKLNDAQVTENTAYRFLLIQSIICLARAEAECAVQQNNRLKDDIAAAKLRGSWRSYFDVYPAIISSIIQELPGADPGVPRDLSTLEEALDGTHYFGPAYVIRAGLAVRAGEPEHAMALLDDLLNHSSNGVRTIDALEMSIEDSLLLKPLHGLPAYADWLTRYRVKSTALRERMIQLEAQGEIVRPEAISRMQAL